jgi:hypothetical protein
MKVITNQEAVRARMRGIARSDDGRPIVALRPAPVAKTVDDVIAELRQVVSVMQGVAQRIAEAATVERKDDGLTTAIREQSALIGSLIDQVSLLVTTEHEEPTRKSMSFRVTSRDVDGRVKTFKVIEE